MIVRKILHWTYSCLPTITTAETTESRPQAEFLKKEINIVRIKTGGGCSEVVSSHSSRLVWWFSKAKRIYCGGRMPVMHRIVQSDVDGEAQATSKEP